MPHGITTWQTDQELLLSTPSATAFLKFVLSGNNEYLDPGVAQVIEAVRKTLRASLVDYGELVKGLRRVEEEEKGGGEKGGRLRKSIQ
jgi:hypothetical protein